MTQIKDGWHIVYDEKVYVESGKVVRGITKDNTACYPYEYSEDYDCWINISGKITLSAYRSGRKKGTKCMK